MSEVGKWETSSYSFNFKSMTEMKIFLKPFFREIRTVKLPEGQVPFVDKSSYSSWVYQSRQGNETACRNRRQLRYQIGTSGQKRDNIDSKPPADGYAEAHQKNMEFLKISYHVQNHAHVLCQLVFFL